MGIQAHHEDIIADKDDECQQSFILLLKELVKCQNKAKDNLFRAIIKYDSNFSLHSLIKATRNHLTRGLY